MPRGSRTRKRPRADTKHNDETTATTITVEEWKYDDPEIQVDDTKGNEHSPNNRLIPPTAIATLDDLPTHLTTAFQTIGIDKPTELQKYVWPILLSSNHDRTNLIVLAPTGSGKTYTYGGMILRNSLLVLTPTRELALQVADTLQRLHRNVTMCAVYGGRNDQKEQYYALKALKAPFVIAATPGRLLDLLKNNVDWKPSVGTIVLDEADRLAMDASLSTQVTEIAQKVSCDRWILASATWPDAASPVWREWLRHPDNTTLTIREHCATAAIASTTQIPPRIQQVLHVCSEHKRRKKLLKTLEKEKQQSGLIFFATIQELKATGSFLRKQNVANTMWHGQLSQTERERIQSLTPPFLILATDVAARGIHNEHLNFIINYDFPSNLEQYVHRCGRIRRSGVCYSFFVRKFQALAPDLVALLEASHQVVDPNLLAMVEQQKRTKQKKSKRPRVAKTGPVDNDESEDDPFPELSGQRIALKRAEDVSDPSSSDDDEEEEEEIKSSDETIE